jgi:predicted transport protein
LGSTGMSDIKLFRLANGSVAQLTGTSVAVEKSLQHLIEKYLDEFLGVTFLASEYSTGKTHGGRIDTLGVDENGYPVIIEYKRALNENVINQGLFYLDWLMDHKADFKLLVMGRLGKDQADSIEWSKPRLLCIAGDFTRYDEHAVQQINRNIELIRYRRYGNELLLFELVNAPTLQAVEEAVEVGDSGVPKPKGTYKTVTQYLAQAKPELRDRYEALKAFLLALGEDVQINILKYYIAFKRIQNFACAEVRTGAETLLVYVKVDPDTVTLEQGFTRDVRGIGHYGTGDLEITIRDDEDLENAKELLVKSYELN